MKTVIIIQARIQSTRLPRKVLQDIAGQSMLQRVVSRARQASIPDEVVIATSTDAADDELAALCRASGWPCFRGSHLDVLDRFYHAAGHFGADVVVRISCDCPLIDPDIMDQVAAPVVQEQSPWNYAANMLEPRTFPRGVDCEAFTFDVLERTWREASDSVCREHVTPWIYRNPDRFRIRSVSQSVDQSAYRWTVDTAEDLELARVVYSHFGHDRFRCADVVRAFEQHPEWTQINAHIRQNLVRQKAA